MLLFSLRLIAKNINFVKLERMLSLAEQRICIYCSFCEPVRSVVSKDNFVLESVYAGHCNYIMFMALIFGRCNTKGAIALV